MNPPRPAPSPPRSRRRLALALAATSVVVLVACDPPGDRGGSTGCAATVREASFAIEVDDQVRLLDEALLVCRSPEAMTAELARYPGIIGYDGATYVARRCAKVDDEAVRDAPTCAAVIDPTTTLPPTTIPTLVFVGTTLDGRQVELRPSATTPFDGDVPAVIQQTVDIAFESGCDGVREQRDRWASRIGDPVTGDEASVYAQHAQNVADYIRCDLEPVDVG